jgi:lipoyl(octanoyl) transferase
MTLEIRISKELVPYKTAFEFLKKRVDSIKKHKSRDLLWILEHPLTFTSGLRSKENEILDKKIKIIKTNRGGKITLHNPGQKIIYFAIDLNKRKRDIRNFVSTLEKTIIETLKDFQIDSFSDKSNIGIWVNHEKKIKKIAAIGLRVRKWIAYHGFAINVENNLEPYKKIIPCGVSDRMVTNLKAINEQNYSTLSDKLLKKFINNLKI